MSKIVYSLLLISVLLFSSAYGQSPVSGTWEGQLSPAPGLSMRIVFNISENDGQLSSSLDSPDQGALGIPVEATAFIENTLSLDLPTIGGQYEGKLVAGQLEGTWSQGGQSFPLNLTRADENTATLSTAETRTIGNWIGSLLIDNTRIRLVFHVEEYNGSLTSRLDSPDQGVMGIPASSPEVEDNSIRIAVPAVSGKFAGILSSDAEKISGTWEQSGQSWDIELVKTDDTPAVERPQEPERPFPYREEEVDFDVPEGGHTLAGTLTLPEGEGPFPAAVLISGSGPQDRDETLMGHKPFLILSDHLTRNGIAVLRYDDRGTAESTGDHSTATSEDFANDARAAVNYLLTRSEIDSHSIGLVGHSEGGLIAPIVAVDSDNLAYIVMMAGPGMVGKDLLPLQTNLILEAGGMDKSDLKEIRRINTLLYNKAAELDPDDDNSAKELATLIDGETQNVSPELLETIGFSSEAKEMIISQLTNPWMHYFFNYDPVPTLKKVDIPVLSIFGEKDLQVPPEQNAPLIQEALEAGGNKNAETVILSGLNHLFQTSDTGSPSEYGTIEETFAPVALEAISHWIIKTVNLK